MTKPLKAWCVKNPDGELELYNIGIYEDSLKKSAERKTGYFKKVYKVVPVTITEDTEVSDE